MEYKLERIDFDSSTCVWKTKLNMSDIKESLLNAAFDVMNSYPTYNNGTDAYSYVMGKNNKLDRIIDYGVDLCKFLYSKTENIYNKYNTDAWINVIRSSNPQQPSFVKGIDDVYHLSEDDNKYHTHTEILKAQNSFYPHYTFVYYIQMPNVMEEEDGVLYFKGELDKQYWIRPEEDDLIIMKGSVPHAPNNAPKSTVDRVVIASNVGFEFVKTQKSLI